MDSDITSKIWKEAWTIWKSKADNTAVQSEENPCSMLNKMHSLQNTWKYPQQPRRIPTRQEHHQTIIHFQDPSRKDHNVKRLWINVLMLDMSKTFNNIKRNTLYQDLADVLDKEELQMMNILLKVVELQVRYGNIWGEPQGPVACQYISAYLAIYRIW